MTLAWDMAPNCLFAIGQRVGASSHVLFQSDESRLSCRYSVPGEGNALKAFWMTVWHILSSVPLRLILIQLVASLAVIRFNDWYCKRREARRESKRRELEALFALRDPREIRSLRPWSQR
jgi:hypothetical protein